VKKLVDKGLSPKEIAKQVGCDLSLVYATRKAMHPDKVRKYKMKRRKAKKADTQPIKFFTPATDNVNSPPHYTKGGIEVYDFIKAKGLSYELGNVVKYVSRAGHKGNKLEDLKKAQWYLSAAIIQEVTHGS
jgi:transposase